MGRLALCRASVVALAMAVIPFEAKADDGTGDANFDFPGDGSSSLPDYSNLLPPKDQSLLDQLIQALKDKEAIDYINLIDGILSDLQGDEGTPNYGGVFDPNDKTNPLYDYMYLDYYQILSDKLNKLKNQLQGKNGNNK